MEIFVFLILQYPEYIFSLGGMLLYATFLKSCMLIYSGKLASQFDEVEGLLKNGTLLIHDVKEEDEGYYMCEANNGVGASLSAVVFLTVNGKCSPPSVLHKVVI
jgi:hypothetical protein